MLRYHFIMLMFVFGAGASFDSDPGRPAPSGEHRPPLAAGIFAPTSGAGREAIARYPRAAPLFMELRQAVARGEDIEEVLEELARDEAYPETAAQLLSFRAYLADLLREVPDAWASECQSLTNYVTLLSRADRWNVRIGATSAVSCVTFNYDTLLERAIRLVFGHGMVDFNAYLDHERVRVYKPHGSVDWEVPARWSVEANTIIGSKDGALTRAIADAGELDWDRWHDWRLNRGHLQPQDQEDRTKVWLPALSIPVRHKATFTMPEFHREHLERDLSEVSTVVAIGWRGRERHFLEMLQDCLPSAPARLVAVGVSVEGAMATVQSLWETGRFSRYAVSKLGFGGFLEDPSNPSPLTQEDVDRGLVRLSHLYSARTQHVLWSERSPGRGLPPTINRDRDAFESAVTL